MKILDIDDLRTASQEDVAAATASLHINDRVQDGLHRRGHAMGLTLDAYNKAMLQLVGDGPCAHCAGSGKHRKDAPRTVGCIHPSAATACVLRLYHDVVGDIAPQGCISTALLLTFAIGHGLHELVQSVLTAEFKNGFEAEARVRLGPLIRGNADGVIVTDLARAVLEIKSMGSEFDGLTKPKPEHRVQAGGLYATALNAPFVVYLYISKQWPHPMKEFVEVYDPQIFRIWQTTKAVRVVHAVDTGVSPVADGDPAECRECPYGYCCDQRLDKKNGRVFAQKGKS